MGLAPSALLIPVTYVTVLLDRIILIMAMIHNCFLLFYILWMNKTSKELSLDNPFHLRLYRNTIYCLLCTILLNFAAFAAAIALSPFSCKALYINGGSIYVLGKMGFWFFSALRIKIAFLGSKYEYKPSFLILLIVFLCINGLLMLCNVVIQMYFEIGYSFTYWYNLDTCIITTIWYQAIAVGVPEAIANIILFWLFYRRINQITNEGSNCSALQYITRKYAILIGTSILSTWILMSSLVVTELALTVSAIDGIINIWCLVLFDARLDNIYLKLFGCIAKKELMTRASSTSVRSISGSTRSDPRIPTNVFTTSTTSSKIEIELANSMGDYDSNSDHNKV